MRRVGLIGLALCACACGVTLSSGRPSEIADDTWQVEERAAMRCIHGTPGPNAPYRQALPGPVTDPELLVHLERFTPEVRRTAVAAGLEPLLAMLLRARELEAAGAEMSSDRLAMRDELSARMFSLETQLTAMEFEVDCVRGLLTDTLEAAEAAESDRQVAFTLASLVVGAVAGIASGIWDLANSTVEAPDAPAMPNAPIITAIAGATATTVLGIAVLVPASSEVIYVHEHNVLTPLVRGEDSGFLYPTFIFNMLSLPGAEGARSPRDELVDRWNDLVADAVDEDERPLAERILYGEGGVYDAELLALHEDLLEELGAALDGLARDIDLLGRAIASVLEDRPAEPAAAPIVPAPAAPSPAAPVP